MIKSGCFEPPVTDFKIKERCKVTYFEIIITSTIIYHCKQFFYCSPVFNYFDMKYEFGESTFSRLN